jgi:hypothetical protein
MVVYLAFPCLRRLERLYNPRQATLIDLIVVVNHMRVEFRHLNVLICRFRRRRSYLRGLNRRDDRVFRHRVAQLRLEFCALARGQYSLTRRR